MTGTRFNYVLAGSVLSIVFLVMGCEQEQASKPAATPSASAKVAGEVCPVSGESLDAMGEPAVYSHEGKEVKFCCSDCVKEFKLDPAKYLVKLDVKAVDDHAGHDH